MWPVAELYTPSSMKKCAAHFGQGSVFGTQQSKCRWDGLIANNVYWLEHSCAIVLGVVETHDDPNMSQGPLWYWRGRHCRACAQSGTWKNGKISTVTHMRDEQHAERYKQYRAGRPGNDDRDLEAKNWAFFHDVLLPGFWLFFSCLRSCK